MTFEKSMASKNSWITSELRVFFTLAIGGILSYRVYRMRMGEFLFSGEIFVGLAITGIVFWALMAWKEAQLFQDSRSLTHLFVPVLGPVFLIIITGIHLQTKRIFETPTLIQLASEHRDFSGESVDIKRDGSYIAGSFSLGADYHFGTWKMYGDTIVFDKKKIANITSSQTYVIQPPDQQGRLVIPYIQDSSTNGLEKRFRVVIDNR